MRRVGAAPSSLTKLGVPAFFHMFRLTPLPHSFIHHHHPVHLASMIFRIGSASFELVLLKPVLYALLSMILLFLALPLTIFGVITTVCSLGILLLRSIVVYSGLPVALITAWLSPPVVVTVQQQGWAPSSSGPGGSSLHYPAYVFHNSETSSESEENSSDIAAPHNPKVTEMTGMHQESEDAETGNWDDEALWLAVSSALQIPMDGIRERKPSLTGEATARERWAFDLTDLHRSPAQNRGRTPYAAPEDTDYFHLQPPMSPLRPTNSESDYL